ncbi:MAG: hypothetical protein Q7J27_00310 [Syntrophales bacterium]|nr:hypothetical protein [Syntrophales bacterium]
MNLFAIISVLLVLLSGLSSADSSGSKSSALTGEKITLVLPRKPDNFLAKWLNMIYTEAFRRLNMEFVYKYTSPKRCILLSDSGKVDGELWRVYDYNIVHPNLIRVEESPFSNRFCAYATAPDIKLNGWESLRDTDYKVDYRRGQMKTHQNLPGIVKKENLTMINHWTHGLKRLTAGRTDIYVDIEWTIKDALKADEFKNSNIHIVGVMETISAHAFLHKKHKELVPKLSAVLKEMKKERLIEKYKAMAEK